MKRLLLVACLVACIVLTLSLGACCSLTYSVQISTAGARTLSLRVNLEEGTDEAERQIIKNFLETVAANRNRNGRRCVVTQEEGYLFLKEEFESATDYYIAMGITGDEPNEEDMPYVDLNAYFREYSSEMTLASNATVVGYALQYAAAATDGGILILWRNFCAEKTMTAPDAYLYPVYAQLAVAPNNELLSATVEALSGAYGNALCIVLSDWLADQGYPLDQLQVHYTYEHIYRSVYAKQYTETYRNPQTGATVYQWDMTAAEIPAMQIVIYQRVPIGWAWELTAIGAGLLTMLIILTIILIRRRKMKNAERQAE